MQSRERRIAVLSQYKKQAAAPMRGRSVYYQPAMRLLRRTLCAAGTIAEKLSALRDACVKPSTPEKLNDARIASNARVFRLFESEFGDKELEIYVSPRLRFIAGEDVEINVQPDLYACVDGNLMLWKFGLNRRSLPEEVIKAVLQMMASAARARGLAVAIKNIRYLDTMTGNVYSEPVSDPVLTGTLKAHARELAMLWRQVG